MITASDMARNTERLAKSAAYLQMKEKVVAFLGKRVRVWTVYQQPVEGTLAFFSTVPPHLVILIDDQGRPRIFNFRNVVEIESREKFPLP